MNNISFSKKTRSILNKGNNWKHLINVNNLAYDLHFELVRSPDIGQVREGKVEAIWSEKFEEAKKKGNILFPGPIMGMKSVSKDRNKINFKLFETNYKYVIASREMILSPQYDYFIGIRGICHERIYKQDCIVIGTRSPKTTDMKGVFESIPAGILVPEDLKMQKPLETRLVNEFKEELAIEENIKIKDMNLISIKGCKDAVSVDIRFLFEVENDWLDQFEVSKHDNFYDIIPIKGSYPEHKTVYLVPIASLSDFLEAHKDSWTVSKDIFLDLYEYLKR